MTGAANGGLYDIYRHTQAALAVGIRRADLHQGDIEVQAFLIKQLRHFTEKDGCVIRDGGVDGIPHVRADEKSVMAEMLEQLTPGVRRFAVREDVKDLDVVNVRSARGQSSDELLRDGTARADENAHAAAQDGQGVLRR